MPRMRVCSPEVPLILPRDERSEEGPSVTDLALGLQPAADRSYAGRRSGASGPSDRGPSRAPYHYCAAGLPLRVFVPHHAGPSQVGLRSPRSRIAWRPAALSDLYFLPLYSICPSSLTVQRQRSLPLRSRLTITLPGLSSISLPSSPPLGAFLSGAGSSAAAIGCSAATACAAACSGSTSTLPSSRSS